MPSPDPSRKMKAAAPAPSTPGDLLRSAGPMLHGSGWQTGLARDLDWPLRSVQRYAAGEYEPSGEFMARLLALVERRAGELGGLAERLRQALDKPGGSRS